MKSKPSAEATSKKTLMLSHLMQFPTEVVTEEFENTSTKPSHQKISEIADLGSVEVENGVEILNKEKLQDIKIKKKGKTKSKEKGDQRLDENSDKKDKNEPQKFTVTDAPAKKSRENSEQSVKLLLSISEKSRHRDSTHREILSGFYSGKRRFRVMPGETNKNQERE
ncbi:hypothetical protein CEXT_305331 [Caerostris extrusa]|uniref:Uncharacterized protein n=1 Tax=Caerostris extrusa TaxID=172846 RepID=A0AAV4N0K6_CAEEX|nr:hypothetical protein CEXT_305331 [Caerostris extrusa]